VSSYVVLTKLRPEGRKRIAEHPERLQEVRREVERMGVRVTAQYAVMGEYDFATFVEAQSNEQVARVGAELTSLGTMRLITLPAVGIDRFQQLLKKEPYRTEPHRWQTSWWARAVRRAGRYWTTARYVRQYCKPLAVEGRENLAGFRGPAIVIANHSSHFDSPVAYMALPARIRNRLAMAAAADKFYPMRKKRVWWPSLFQNAFPVHRGGGVKQLDYPLSLLRRGWSILIYPEGGRSKSGQIARFKAGPAIMAMQGKVPVIPVYMEGLRAIMPKGQRSPQPGPVTVRIGAPVRVDDCADVSEATARLENALRALAGIAPHHHTEPSPAPAPEPAMAQASGG
jgi:1-acyl-sn-glycerol-3-phosphate acyltransferase